MNARRLLVAPLATAAIFVGVVIALDVGVAALINRSAAMFASVLGTWIPFALIFASTFVTGRALGADFGSRKQ